MQPLAVLAACALAGCAAHLPAPKMSPLRSPSALRPRGALRVMTFNIQSGSRGLESVARAIRLASPDLVALQEVDKGTRRSGGLDQAERLAELTGLGHHAHFPATDKHGGAYGLALLSRLPLEAIEHWALPCPKGVEPRAFARARVRVAGAALHVYVTHLSHLPNRGELRRRQTARILRAIAADPHPKILMGDLNEGAGSSAVSLLSRSLRDVFAHAGFGPSGTYPLPLFLPDLRLDYVFASAELAPVSSFVLRVPASDHYPVVADLRLEVDAVAERRALTAPARSRRR